MNFQNIRPIPTSKELLDKVLGKARTKISQKAFPRGKKIDMAKAKEHMRIDIVTSNIQAELQKISDDFPSFDSMSDFYNRLVKAQLDYVTLKKSLASLKWARTKVKELSRMFMGKMSKSADMNSFVKHRSAFVGRISSVIKQIEPNLKFLIDVRILLRSFPDIKDDMMTVSLYGFPNAGKTTILSKLTDSNPKIANYAFTTKTLNLGYMKVGFRKIQIIDTPGTLNRQNKMNSIELQAEVALRTVSDVIVVLLDCSDTYSVADQKELLKRARDTGKEVLIYFSKTDLASEGRIKEFNINERTIDSPEKLGEILKKKLGHFNGALAR